MTDPVEEAVLKEYVVDALMRCKLCNVTAANQTTWESHKQGKKHLKLLKKEVDIRRLEESSSTAETKREPNEENEKPEGEVPPPSTNTTPSLIGMDQNDPILAFITGMEDVKPQVSEKYLKRQRKRREKQQKEDEQIRHVEETHNREREEETAAINASVKHLELHVKPVASDGNCLYRAIAEQLALNDSKMNSPTAYRVVRRRAANYMRDHREEFQMFLEDDVDYEIYCDKVEGSNEWGGQLELRALSLVYNRPIHVYSADAPVVIMGEDIIAEPLFISYHKKYLSLGNHYNTLVPI